MFSKIPNKNIGTGKKALKHTLSLLNPEKKISVAEVSSPKTHQSKAQLLIQSSVG